VKITRIYERANPSSKVADLRALFDSYRYQFNMRGQVFVEAPLWMFAIAHDVGLRPRYSERPRPKQPALALQIDNLDECSGILARGSPPVDEEGRALSSNSRWPFWVDEELLFQFLFETDTEHMLAQEFLFEPGRKYETETVHGFIGGR
jgi:hypothetical protein